MASTSTVKKSKAREWIKPAAIAASVLTLSGAALYGLMNVELRVTQTEKQVAEVTPSETIAPTQAASTTTVSETAPTTANVASETSPDSVTKAAQLRDSIQREVLKASSDEAATKEKSTQVKKAKKESAVKSKIPTPAAKSEEKTSKPSQSVSSQSVATKELDAPATETKDQAPTPSLAEQTAVREKAVESSLRQALMHLKLQQSKEAISEFKKVISLDPLNSESHRGIGLAYVYEKDFESAISSLKRYLEIAKTASDKASVEELISTLKERIQGSP
jgi:tetratricopeptide (TPR) repeat protein